MPSESRWTACPSGLDFPSGANPLNRKYPTTLDKQLAWAAQFFDVARHFCGTNVRLVHLVLAAPNSVVLRFGRAYDKRNLPQIIVHQYENAQTPPYPWGVLMPVGGVTSSEIIRRQ